MRLVSREIERRTAPIAWSLSLSRARWLALRPQERLNKEIRRRTDVVGIFPNRASLLRLVGMLLAEQDDEWAVGRNYFSAESMLLIDAPRPSEEVPAALLIAS